MQLKCLIIIFCHIYLPNINYCMKSMMCTELPHTQFSVPQIEYPLGGNSKKGSHVYFLLRVAMVLLL